MNKCFLCIDAECSNIPYTYCSKSNGCKSTIYHFMVTQNLRESIIKYESVFMNSDFSDHVPICLEMQIDVSYHESFEHKCKTNVAWHKCTEVHIVYVIKEETRINSNRMAEAINEGNDRNLWTEVHSLKKYCLFLPNVIHGHIGSEDIADLFSSKFEQLYNSAGFDKDHMHLLKSRVDNLVSNMCMHENYENYGHNCHQQHGINVDDLKKCVNCMKHGKKEKHGISSNHIIYGTEKLFKALTLL